MGNLFADALLQFDPRIDLAIVNSGSLRQDIDMGPVTRGDLVSAFPFPNTLDMVQIKGSQLRDIFDHAAQMTNGVCRFLEARGMYSSLAKVSTKYGLMIIC